MTLDFQNDIANVCGEKIPLIKTSSGHYIIPITKAKQIITKQHSPATSQVTLTVMDTTSEELAPKLHRQFAHPSKEKLLQRNTNAVPLWSNNKELIKEVKDVSRPCPTCKIYRKPPPRAAVGLPMSNTFQETVAIDLKHCKGKLLLHIVDHCTRLSASNAIPNKQPETTIKYIFKTWISVFGLTAKFLTDHGGEFANSTFTSMCESLGIVIKTRAAESRWSNGLIKRHNLILVDMLDKVLEETQCDLEPAVAWCVNGKNSLSNIHSFSPYQLAIGTNPKLPSMMSNRAPTLTATPSSKVISNNLRAINTQSKGSIHCQ